MACPTDRRRRIPAASLRAAYGVAAACAALATAPAQADPEDPLTISLGATRQHDDNLFRLAPGVDPAAALGKPTRADDLDVTSLRVRYDKTFSQQHITLDASANQYRYHNFSYLNFNANDYNAIWQWNVTRSLSGHVIASRQHSSSGFTDYRNYRVASIRTSTNRRFDLDWWVLGGWHVIGGASESTSINSQSQVAEVSSRYRPIEAGVSYVNAAGNSLTLVGRRGHGEYPGQTLNNVYLLDTAFDQSEREARLHWQLTGKSTVNTRVTHIDRRQTNFAQRNFRENTGQFDYIWQPTGKLQLTASASRNAGAYIDWTLGAPLSSSYYVDRGVSLAPAYQLSAKTAIKMGLQHTHRDYKGAIIPLPMQRWDETNSAQLEFDWTPMRSLSISASLQRSHRESAYQGLEFRDNSANLSAQFTF